MCLGVGIWTVFSSPLPLTAYATSLQSVEIISTLSLTQALDGVGGQNNSPVVLSPLNKPCSYCIGRWVVGPRDGLDECGKSRSHRVSIPGPPIP